MSKLFIGEFSSRSSMRGISFNNGGRYLTFSALTWEGFYSDDGSVIPVTVARWRMIRLWAFGYELFYRKWRSR